MIFFVIATHINGRVKGLAVGFVDNQYRVEKCFMMCKKKKSNKRVVMMVDRGVSFGGSLVVIARLAKSLDRTRYEPIIVSSMDWATIRHHVPNDIKVYRATEPYNYVRWSKTVQLLKKINPKYLFKLTLYLFIFIQLIMNSYYMLRLMAIILTEKVDLVHVNNSTLAVVAAKFMRRATLWHMHGRSREESEGSKISWFIYKSVDRYISISRFISDMAVKDGVSASKIETLHNPIDEDGRLLLPEEKAMLKQKYQLVPAKIVIGVFGRLVSWKGQLQLLQAVKILCDKNIPLQLLIVGDDGEKYGSYTAELKRFVVDSELTESVVFTGYVLEVSSLYQICDIVVHPSISDEPFGLVITEAMHNSCATICSVHGAGPELVNDGYDGFIVDPLDKEKLAEKIERLILDPELRKQIATRGQERVVEQLSPSKYASDVANIYDDVLFKSKENRACN